MKVGVAVVYLKQFEIAFLVNLENVQNCVLVVVLNARHPASDSGGIFLGLCHQGETDDYVMRFPDVTALAYGFEHF